MEIKSFLQNGAVLPNNQNGYTIVELVIALVMSTIVLAGIFIIVSGSHEYLIKGRKKTNLQQDFSLIAQILGNKIRPSIYGNHGIYNNYSDYMSGQPTQSSGTCLKLKYTSGDSCVIYKDNSNFKIIDTDLTITNLVPDVVDSLFFTAGTKFITTALTLAQGNQSISSTLLAVFRNSNASTSTSDTLRPMGIGTYSNNKKSSCSKNWQCVDDIASDGDATYVKAKGEESWKTDSYDTEDGSGSGTIDSVIVYISVKDGNSSGDKAQTVVLISGTGYYGTVIDTDGLSSYTTFFTTYTANPATSSAWAWADIDAMQIGIRLYRDDDDSNGPRCTQVWAEVFYTQ